MSAPCSNGRSRNGVATVLSTISGTPAHARLGNGGDVGDVAARVADRFDEHRLGALVDQRGERRRIGRVGEARLDGILRQRVCQQVEAAAIQRAGGDDVVTGLGDGLRA